MFLLGYIMSGVNFAIGSFLVISVADLFDVSFVFFHDYIFLFNIFVIIFVIIIVFVPSLVVTSKKFDIQYYSDKSIKEK